MSLDNTGILHSEDWFPGRGGIRLYRQSWEPIGQAKAAIIVVHGLFEHSGRYANLVDHVVPRGFAVYSFDQRGHGKSEGTRGYVRRFSDYVDDLETFHRLVIDESRGIPVFLFGHSIGGTIAASYIASHQRDFAGCILSAAVAAPGESVTRSSILTARALSAILPRIGIATIEASAISRDPEVVERYIKDPLVFRGKIRARLGSELINAMQRSLPAQMPKVDAPILLIHGSLDRLSNTLGSSRLYALARSEDKTLQCYDGFYHELLNEPGREQVLADITLWLDRHICQQASLARPAPSIQKTV